MTIRNAKSKLEQRLKIKAKVKKVIEYIVIWALILLAVAITVYPVQYLATKHCLKKMQDKEKTHVTILIDGEKLTLEDVDIVHIMED